MTFQVLEPNWHVMHDRLQSTKSVDEVSVRNLLCYSCMRKCALLKQCAFFILQVIQHHDFFLDKCLRGCLLLLPDVLKVCCCSSQFIFSQDQSNDVLLYIVEILGCSSNSVMFFDIDRKWRS